MNYWQNRYENLKKNMEKDEDKLKKKLSFLSVLIVRIFYLRRKEKHLGVVLNPSNWTKGQDNDA